MKRLLLALALVLAACDDGGGPSADAAAIIPTIDAAPTVDGGGFLNDAPPGSPDGGKFDGIDCDTDTVSLHCNTNELCCTDSGGNRQCVVDAPGACTGDDIASCDGPEDCEGAEICCGAGGGNSSAACSSEKACTAGLPRCHTGPDCASGVCCPQGFCGPGCD